jgi:adenylate kinase
VDLIFLGPPGAGKGTQARLLQQREGIPQISTGDILRVAMGAQTELGKRAKAFVDRGALVPDDVMIAIVADRLGQPDARQGFVLDGFPRTLPQAEALDTVLAAASRRVDAVLYFEMADEPIVQRLAGRRVCAKAGHIYHLTYSPPKTPGRCDLDGSELIQRADDRSETVRHRLEVYHRETRPVVDFYRRRGLFDEVDASGEIEDVYRAVWQAITARARSERM